jgi:protein TonB
MPENNNPAQPVGRDRPVSTTEEILRMLGAQPHGPDEDTLSNPELEQLLGSLSKGLEEGIPDSALGTQPAGSLTLEDLAAGLARPLDGLPLARPAREAAVACAGCGSANPASTRFCGMCGRELAQPPRTEKVSGNGSEATTALTGEPEAAAPRRSGRGWKIACLALLYCVLGLAVYEQQLWRSPVLRGWISIVLKTPLRRAVPPTPANLPDAPAPEPAARPLSAVHAPNTVAHLPRTSSSKPAPADAETSPVLPAEQAASPSASASRESPDRAPAVPTPTSSAELPAIFNPPSASPVLQGARTPAPPSAVIPGALIIKVNPDYPPAARNARVQGAVVMHATIGKDGSVQQLRLISGNPLLVGAAMEAVKKWRYRPFMLDGKPVEGETDITVNFLGE